jgi:phosphate transport system permease protein
MNSARRLRRRQLAETAFRFAAAGALAFAASMFVILAVGVMIVGSGAFVRHETRLSVALDPAILGVDAGAQSAELRTVNFRAALRRAMTDAAGATAQSADPIALSALLSPGAEFELADRLARDPGLLGATITVKAPLSDAADRHIKGEPRGDTRAQRLTESQRAVLAELGAKGLVRRALNWEFFTNGDSSYPELAGLAAGMVGSFLAVGLAMLIAVPLGVVTAVFLEEFAPKNALTDFLEININNLAAVPSIIFGLLGLVVFVIALGMPRSAPLVGGLVLALMTLPTIIIVTRSALQALPTSLKEGAIALGASRLGAVIDPLLPAAAPGIATGVIIGIARALGETAPLILIGMVAFVATPPHSLFEPSSALPVLVYLWAESPEAAFAEKTAGAIIVLLALLLMLNALAAYIRVRLNPFRR